MKYLFLFIITFIIGFLITHFFGGENYNYALKQSLASGIGAVIGIVILEKTKYGR